MASGSAVFAVCVEGWFGQAAGRVSWRWRSYPKPNPFGGMGKPIDENGFSDHFPIGVHVTEAD